MRNLKIIIEKAKNNYSAYCLGLPGCIATGRTIKEVKKNMQEAIKMHTEKEIKLKLKGKEFTLKYWIEDNWYVGRLKEIRGVFSQGKTLKSLKENIKDAYNMMTAS